MLIKKVWFKGFADFPETEVEFPDTGIVTVTGRNGTGKTVRCLEAPAWAAWGKTLRDAPPTTTKCSVRLHTDKLIIQRGSQRSDKLTWNYTGKSPVVFETSTKAQDALEVELGDLLTWRRTHVFSSADAALFSGATDAERKRLLEKLIGVAVFDDAASHAKKDLQAIQARLNGIRTDIALSQQRIESFKREAVNLKDILSKSGASVEVDVDALRQEIFATSGRRTELTKRNNELLSQISQAKAKVSLLSSARLKHSNGTCYACQQPIPETLIKQQDEELKAANQAIIDVEDSCRAEMLEMSKEAQELDDQLRELQANLTKATSTQSEMIRSSLAQLRESFKVEQEKINILNFDLELVAEEADVMEHVIRVLGVRGVRSRILAKTLTSLEDLANTYLGWLCTGVKLGLSAQTELGNGKIQDKIEIRIEGYGGGNGYKALSGGQRRRVDLSLLLALASLSRSKGTLIFDEAFDALDTDGVQAACELLQRVSQTRPVIVITHNPALVDSLDGTRMAF